MGAEGRGELAAPPVSASEKTMEGPFRFRGGGRWRRRSSGRPQFSSVALLCGGLLLFLLLFLFLFSEVLRAVVVSPHSPLPDGINVSAPLLQCSDGSSSLMGNGERFLLYAPHSGFSNQLSELRNAILFAAILNRTLVVPPVLDHHAIVLGSCPKFRVSSPSDLRASVWDHTMELLRNRRFVSMADVIDLSSLVSSSMVRFIDFREFASAWCGIDMDLACTARDHESLPKEFQQCRDLLSGLDSGVQDCVYGVEDDCRTTVWTYGQDSDGTLDPFQPDQELQKRKKISYVRRRRDVYKAFGPGSKSEAATVLAFGSLFSAPYKGNELYIDIHGVPTDSRIQSLLRKIDYLPFAQEILNAGKEFALNKIKGPFLCAQLRLLDGQFKNHWKEAFSALRQKIELIQTDIGEKKNRGPVSIFVMTDLPAANWTGTYLADLSSNSSSFKLFTLPEDDELVARASMQLMSAGHSLRTPLLLENRNTAASNKKICPPLKLPSILLYVQEAVCSCASLGFVGTSGSTIAENIELMRKNDVCSSERGLL